MTSFRMQFEKVGPGLLREAKRREGECAVLSKAKGDKKKVSVLENEVNTAVLTVFDTIYGGMWIFSLS